MRFMIATGGPIRDVTDQSVFRRFELHHPHFAAFDIKIVPHADVFGIRDEIRFPDRLHADGIKFLSRGEIVVLAMKTLGECKWTIEYELRIAIKTHRDWRRRNRHQSYGLSAAVYQPVPAI